MQINKLLKRILTLVSVFAASTALACGLHQRTDFSFVFEPGSLDVFENVIKSRQEQELGNPNKPDHFRVFAFKGALAKPYPDKIDFSLFEAIKGHYSEISVIPTSNNDTINLKGRDTLPTAEDLLLVSELDVLDTLANGGLTWVEAKQKQLVVINGPEQEVQRLDAWFNATFQ